MPTKTDRIPHGIALLRSFRITRLLRHLTLMKLLLLPSSVVIFVSVGKEYLAVKMLVSLINLTVTWDSPQCLVLTLHPGTRSEGNAEIWIPRALFYTAAAVAADFEAKFACSPYGEGDPSHMPDQNHRNRSSLKCEKPPVGEQIKNKGRVAVYAAYGASCSVKMESLAVIPQRFGPANRLESLLNPSTHNDIFTKYQELVSYLWNIRVLKGYPYIRQPPNKLSVIVKLNFLAIENRIQCPYVTILQTIKRVLFDPSVCLFPFAKHSFTQTSPHRKFERRTNTAAEERVFRNAANNTITFKNRSAMLDGQMFAPFFGAYTVNPWDPLTDNASYDLGMEAQATFGNFLILSTDHPIRLPAHKESSRKQLQDSSLERRVEIPSATSKVTTVKPSNKANDTPTNRLGHLERKDRRNQVTSDRTKKESDDVHVKLEDNSPNRIRSQLQPSYDSKEKGTVPEAKMKPQIVE
ncbi:hypothetical protein T265_00737 [Opisthorchis viverrini]|uniref:Uncharacterized protein n=1 Tax=Opisthorchis viverrini TaxID=6198 RepID=A0A075A555_OPIVI|nr:hypothetical protein T265_00737 [Opisthorchis viverrini]KER33427.1 hypothetical protein T265_00737 [Opisthorchis viverrini]